jgi:hypothetical protein
MRLPANRLKPVRLRIRGARWTIRFASPQNMGTDWGRCWEKPRNARLIEIRRSLSERDMCNTIIHECLHACVGDLKESTVDEAACVAARALYAAGYRRARSARCVKKKGSR